MSRAASPLIRKAGIVCAAEDAVSVVGDKAVVAVSGFNMANTPECLILELYNRYKRTGHPRDLYFLADALPAIPERALDVVAKNLFLRKDSRFMKGISVPFLGFSPWLQKLATENVVEAYSWAMGSVSLLVQGGCIGKAWSHKQDRNRHRHRPPQGRREAEQAGGDQEHV